MRRQIMVIAGTRPEAIKLFPVIRKLQSEPLVKTIVYSTGQHDSLIVPVWKDLGINPDITRSSIIPTGTVSCRLAMLISEISKCLQYHKPDMVVVQGDTMSTLAGALAAYGQKIKIAHVEAGLRTYDRQNPWPEEGFRVMVDSISDLLFAPTKHSYDNLVNEGVLGKKFITGNTIVDALELMKSKEEGRDMVVWTMHRRESEGEPVKAMLRALYRLARQHDNLEWHVIQHCNGLARLRDRRPKNIVSCDPLPYSQFVKKMSASKFIVTDSGGIQEETSVMGIRTFVIRESTERQEAVICGTAELIGREEKSIVRKVSEYIKQGMPKPTPSSVYGDGKSSTLIVDALKCELGLARRLRF